MARDYDSRGAKIVEFDDEEISDVGEDIGSRDERKRNGGCGAESGDGISNGGKDLICG